MDYFDHWLARPYRALGALLLVGVASLAMFAALYGFHPTVDTDSYLLAIDFYSGRGDIIYPNRYLNPLYPVAAATFLPFLSAESSLTVLNIIFFLGLLGLTYDLIRRVFKKESLGFMTAALVATAYPMLRYALPLQQDMGGFFWFVLTIYGAWRWFESKNWAWFYLASAAVAFGVLTKESGCMGAIFMGIIIILDKAKLKDKIIRVGLFSILPLFTIIVNARRGTDVDYDSLRWFIDNWQVYAPTNYTFIKFVGVNSTAFNLAWIAGAVGLYFLIKNWRQIDKNIKIYLLAIIPASLTYFLWPLFIGRTVFISAWLVFPLAALGFYQTYQRGRAWRYLVIGWFALTLMMPFVLQSTLRYGHMFEIIERCHYDPICSWQYFWRHRAEFSKIT